MDSNQTEVVQYSQASDFILLSLEKFREYQTNFKSSILGKYCIVKVGDNQDFLCKLFCDITLASNYVIIGTKVGENVFSVLPESCCISIRKCEDDVFTSKTVRISVIFHSLQALDKWENYTKKSTLLQDLLAGLVFSEGIYINTKAEELGKLFGIDFILIRECGSKQLCKINSSTKIEVVEGIVIEQAKQMSSKLDICTAGVRQEISILDDVVKASLKSGRRFWKGALIWGPHGCGRGQIPLEIARRNGMFLMKLTSDDVSSSFSGESEQNLKRLFDNARRYSKRNPVLLLIENIETLSPRKSSSTPNQRRIGCQLVSELDLIRPEENVFVIGSTASPGLLDAALRRPGRMDKEVHVGMPDAKARCELIEHFVKQYSLKLSQSLNTRGISDRLVGYSRDDLERLVGTISSDEPSVDELTALHFERAIHQVGPSAKKADILGVTDQTETRWTEVGGLERAKLAIKKAVEWPLKYPEALERFGIPKPRGILLYGPPGCGKTLLVRAAATECSASFLTVKASEIFSAYVGESEKMIASLFAKARLLAPCILFLDELDSIVGSRESSGSAKNGQQGVISTLLQEMDGITATSASVLKKTKAVEGVVTDTAAEEWEDLKAVSTEGVILVGATNRPDKIDPALLRPGRLDTHVYVPPPDTSSRYNVLKVATHKMPLRDVDLYKVAEMSEGYSGADLMFLCKEAGLTAMSEKIDCDYVEMKHFLEALENVKPSISKADLLSYESYSNR